jgi:hypothetical protein
MQKDIQALFDELESKKKTLLQKLSRHTEGQLRFQPAPDRWSMLMALHHIILGERGMRLTEAELRDNPIRRQLKIGKLFEVVLEVLEKDVPVEVPDPSLEPENNASLNELSRLWDEERVRLGDLLDRIREDSVHEVIFSHPAAGPLDPVRTLRLAHAHFDTHRRQIERLEAELE